MRRRPAAASNRIRGMTLSLAMLLMAGLVAACSTSGGSAASQIPLYTGLGSYSDSASSTPAVAVTSPAGQFAFVYDNQIWIKPNNTGQPHQLTKIPILANSYVA